MSNLDIGFYISILKRKLPLILAVALAVLVAAVVATRFMPPSYTASAKMLAEAPQIPADLARSTVSLGATEQLLVIQQQITTRDALFALAEKLDIYAESKVKPGIDDIARDLRSRIRFDQEQLDAGRGPGGVAVFTVSFSANKPDLAAKVANGLVAMILARNQSERTGLATSTLQFFDQKVDGLDADLKKLEAQILRFKNQNKDTLPENLEFHRNQQSAIQDRLSALEREEADLRTRRNSLIVAYTSAGQLSNGNVALSPEQQMLADLNRALADQLTVFTEESPNIVAIRARIATLQKRLAVAPPNTSQNETKDDDKKAKPASAATFGLDLELSDIDNRLQVITQERVTITKRMNDLTKWIAATPATETALDSLLRNRANIQTQYNAAIGRRAEALTGEQIELRADGERFSLLEAATPPTKPLSPKRKLIIAGGGAAGIVLGLAIVVLLEMLNKNVRRPKDLERLLQSPPLGTIPVVRTRREIRAAKIRLATAAFASASAVPVALVALHYYYMPLGLVFQKLASGFGLIGMT